MRKTLPLLVAVLTVLLLWASPVSAATRCWRPVASPTTVDLNDVQLVGPSFGCAVGDAGTVLRYDGVSWTTIAPPTTADLLAVDFFDATTGWAVGDGGVILRTIDRGATWQPLVSGTTVDLNDVDFLDAMTGWAAGGDRREELSGVILRTDNGGLNWTPQSMGAQSWPLNTISMGSLTTGAAAGDSWGSYFFHTSDGANWQPTWLWPWDDVTANRWSFACVRMGDAQTGWAVGNYATREAEGGPYDGLFVTTDGGNRWTNQWFPPRPAHGLRALCVLDPQHVWAVGSSGNVVRTTSGGRRWRLETYGLTPLNAIDFRDGLNGVAVGDGGHIYATSNGWRDVTRPKTRAPSACTVRRGRTAKLKYRVNDIDSPLCRVTVRINKLSGGRLKTIALGYRRAGRLCTVKFRCTLPVGTYRFRVTARDAAGNRQSVTGSNILHVVR